MQLIKIIIVLLLLGCVSNATGYDSEGGLLENETIHADYDLWMDSFQWYTQTPGGTYIYKPENFQSSLYPAMGFFSWVGWQITAFLTTDTEIPVTWTLQGKTWNSDTQTYEDKGTEYVTGYLLEVTGDVEATKTVKKDPITEYFTNDTTRADDFIGIEDDPQHPDYVEVNMSVGAGMEDIEHSEEYGITMSGDEAEACAHHGTGQDLGFGSGRGGAGGTGELYNRVVYNDESGSKQLFIVIFYGVIPLIFLMYGFRMIGKITSSYGRRRR